MPQCYVSSCSNYYGKTRGTPGIIYHMVPASRDMTIKWARACGRNDKIPPSYARVCSNHFSAKCYQRDLQHELLGLPLRRKLKNDAVPDQNLTGNTKQLDDKSVPGNENTNCRSLLKNNVNNCTYLKHSNQNSRNEKNRNDADDIKTNDKIVLKCKNNNRFNKRPMRSSIRIAKKKSIELLSDSFTSKVNSKNEKYSKPERFSDKLKFMAKLQLKYEKNRHVIDLDTFFENITNGDDVEASDNGSLNKMQIMEDVKEGCNVQPSSPGHAEQRSNEVEVKSETNGGEYESQENEENGEEGKIECEKLEAKDLDNETEIIKPDPDANSLNEENYSNSSSSNPEINKRKFDHDEVPVKRLKSEIHQNFNSRDKILNDFIDMAECNNMEQIHSFSEQLLAEIKTLNELAKEKEREWNNIIHLKKLKEELLLRMQRKRQVLMINEKSDYAELLHESQNGSTEDSLRNISQSILKYSSTSPSKSTSLLANTGCANGSNLKYRNIQPKPSHQLCDLNGSSSAQQAKRLTLDVQSIIADYRQRHPETVPRRGRRIRSHTDVTNKYPNSILNFSSMTLGSGSQMRHGTDINGELGLLLNTINSNKPDPGKLPNPDSTMSNPQDSVSFKDMLLQFAKLSQSERNELIQNAIKPPTQVPVKPPPPYPEVTVHPVRDPVPTTSSASSSSLLHGILTKTPTKQNSKTSFSPTLARLLTAPEKAAGNLVTSTPTITNTTIHPSNMSISEILSTSKAHNEITITPVDTYEATPTKARNGVEEEAEDSADRLVIDENSDAIDARKPSSTDNNSEAGDEVPLCQGCNQKPAQFVCAGCGNQWYCSRDCQVTAWDEHSEVCSG
ncbi:unnamed protein product [Phaedon cochleariae]|uniref:Uncharacterized protein n=1 Tax=Phaedon cochleariae TaxID=80249 RepID=A0A9P0DPR0_PHACE|nr:unnamed protein product [Phaedon cochleariae]